MSKHLFVVFTNAVEGKEDEFNDWYTNTHLPDLVDVPGCEAAQRFELSHTQRMEAPHPWKYMSIYEIDNDNIQGFMDALNGRRGTDKLVMTDTIAAGTTSFFYAPITERVTASAAKHAAE